MEKEDNTKTVYPPHFYQHEVGDVLIDDTPARIKIQKMKIAGWTLPEEEQVKLLNLGTEDAPQCIKVNSTLPIPIATQANALFSEYKDVFAWNYKDLRGIPERIAQHKIELDIGIPPAHQSKYRMNPNYASIVKQDIDKLLAAGFVEPVDNATWLSPIVVVPKKNGKLRICVDFRKLNAATKKDPYTVHRFYIGYDGGHEMYSFLDGYSGYHQIKIAPEDRFKRAFVTDWGAFVWVVMPFGLKNAPATYQKAVNLAFREYIDVFMKLFLDDFSVYSDTVTHLEKLQKCFQKCREFGISLNLEKNMFLVHSGIILGDIVSKEGKFPDPKKIQVVVNLPRPKKP